MCIRLLSHRQNDCQVLLSFGQSCDRLTEKPCHFSSDGQKNPPDERCDVFRPWPRLTEMAVHWSFGDMPFGTETEGRLRALFVRRTVKTVFGSNPPRSSKSVDLRSSSRAVVVQRVRLGFSGSFPCILRLWQKVVRTLRRREQESPICNRPDRV
jgi:hypothetical protein